MCRSQSFFLKKKFYYCCKKDFIANPRGGRNKTTAIRAAAGQRRAHKSSSRTPGAQSACSVSVFRRPVRRTRTNEIILCERRGPRAIVIRIIKRTRRSVLKFSSHFSNITDT